MSFTRLLFITVSVLTTLAFSQASYAEKTGNVSGKITYKGKAPKFREIKMEADPICLSKHTDKVLPQSLVLGEDNAMANVFVYLKKGVPNKKYPVPTDPAVISQEGCMYDPHVLAVMVGQTVKFLNPDGTLHNVHSLSKVNPEFNLAMPKFRKETNKSFAKAEFMFPIKCDVHPWMASWVAVMDHPYFDITEKNGRFSIRNVPVGEYTLEAWHEKLGTQSQSIYVKSNIGSKTSFTFSRK